VDAKSNEIAAVRDLMKAFTDLAGAVIMIDALHTQAEQAATSVKGTSGDLARIRRMTSQRGST
jgi:predicted transposase YbfD/YdcC